MDPDITLENLRDALSHVSDNPDDSCAVEDLVEAATALDEWLTTGGFLPKEWTR